MQRESEPDGQVNPCLNAGTGHVGAAGDAGQAIAPRRAAAQCSMGYGRGPLAKAAAAIRSLFGENPKERDERAHDHDGLEADRSHHPFEDISLDLGNLGLEPRLKRQQIRLSCHRVLLPLTLPQAPPPAQG